MDVKPSKIIRLLLLVVLMLVATGSLSNELPLITKSLAAPPVQQGGQGISLGPELGAADVVHLFWHGAVRGATTLDKASLSVSDLGLSAAEAQNPKRVAQAFMETQSAALQITQTANIAWQPTRTEADKLGNTHVILQEMYNDIPVLTAEVIVHIKDGVSVTAANGEYPAAINVSPKPTLSPQAAYKVARHQIPLEKPILVEDMLVIYNPALLGLGPSANHLAYRLVVGQKDGPDLQVIFVDAHTGKVLFNYNNLQEGRNRAIYDLRNGTSLPGAQCYTETGPVPGGSPSADCTNTYTFTGDTYNYFFNIHGRDSYDGSGGTMRASVNYGTTANAFWNGSQTAFGPGFSTKDVVAHEWTHAVTQYTAGLIYAYQSGALNESVSDIFGTMVDRDDWLMGEDTPIGAIRSLADPTLFGDPGKVSDSQYFCGSSDNGGVHINSGVPNHTAYLMAVGGTYNGFTITGIDRGPTEQIFYRALNQYLTSGSDFADAANSLNSACADLFGGGSAQCVATGQALQATEMAIPACGGSGGVPDSYEPDDTVNQAQTISIDGSPQSHNFHDAGDNDWAQFSATAGTAYEIRTSNLGSRSDTYMYLYDTDGTTIIAQDDDGGEGAASLINWTASSNGTYYVRVRHYSSSTFGADTDYDLSVAASGGTSGADSYEDDDSPAQASSITPNGGIQTHNFHDAGDVDWVQFSATAGLNYVIETLNLGSQSDTVLELYDTDATTLITTDDDSGGGRASRIEWAAPANGTYYLRVRHYISSVFGPDTNYDLKITTSGFAPDSYEDDDTVAQANPITVNGGPQTHNFHDAGDEDWVQFSTTAGISHVVETSNLGSRSDTVLELYDTDGVTLLASDDDGGDGLASRIAWTAPADGTYYVRAHHFSSSVSGSDTNYDLQVTGTTSGSADSFEPDDTPAQASTITVNGAIQTHNFHDAGDEDWVTFAASVGINYVLETFNLGSASDTFMELYDTDAVTLIASNDDGGDGLASRISWTAPASGNYYIRVRHYRSSAFGVDTNYDLSVTGSGTPGTPDNYEEDDTPAQASVLAGTQADHNFHDAGDEDWAQFSATVSANYVLETLNLGSRSDTVLYLYDTDGSTLIASNDDNGGTLASRIEWTAPANGTYYVRVRHFSGSIFGANTNYDLRLIGGGDIYEPDDTPAQASLIPADGTPQTHNFGLAGDQDWVQFSATSNESYTIETFNLGPASDTVLELYDTDTTTLLDLNDDGGSGLASQIVWTAPASGDYFIKVRHYSSNASGNNTNYDLSVTGSAGAGDSFEPDNNQVEAGSITVNGNPQTHDFHVAGDNDWVQFSATTGTAYVIETGNLGPNSDTFMTLYDTDGTAVLVMDDDSGVGLASKIEWTAPADGVYFVNVRHYNSGVSGPDTQYDLTVTSASSGGGDTFEPDNVPAQASTITVDGSAQPHNFHVAGDDDWASFSATAGSSYAIETSNLGSGSDTFIELYDTNGTTLITSDDDGGTGLASRIEWIATAGGTYYVRVRHYSGSAFGPETNYDLQVTSTSNSSPDSFEPDDDAGSANAIATDGTVQTHNFHADGDADWVQFPTSSGQTCTIETANLGSRSDTTLNLYDSSLTLITSDDDSGTGLASRIVQTISSTETYYVEVRHFNSSISGADTNYDLAVSCVAAGADSFEPDDTAAQASPITVDGSAQTHDFHVAGDLDWIQFPATAGLNYVIETFNLGSSGDTVISLYDIDGTTLIASDDDGGDGLASRIAWTAPAGGTYYVRISHFGNNTFGPDTNYDISVTTVANALAPTASVELTIPAAYPGEEVEATVYLHRAASAVKVEVLAKSTYLTLTEATPLSVNGQALGEQVTIDSDRWQLSTREDGLTSIWYEGKLDWDGSQTVPVLRLRWQLAAPLPADKLALTFRLTTVDQGGQAVTRVVELPVISLAEDPKIDDVQPRSVSNSHDEVISIFGTNFKDTPKVYLVAGSQQIQLAEVQIIVPEGGGDPFVRATVLAGTKAGVYKIRLVNPDDRSAEFDNFEVLSESQIPQYSLIVAAPLNAQSGDAGTTVTYTLHTTNTGNITSTFDVELAGNAWPTTATPNPVEDVAAGASAVVEVAVTIPADVVSGATDTVTVTLRAQEDASAIDSVMLTTVAFVPQYSLTLAALTVAQSGDAGTAVTYTLQMTNTGNVTSTFDVELAGHVWPTTAIPNPVEDVAAGASAVVEVAVTIPADVVSGATDTVTVTLRAQEDASATDSVTLTTTAVTQLKVYLPLIMK
jgi:Zn-dependent metalloprotease